MSRHGEKQGKLQSVSGLILDWTIKLSLHFGVDLNDEQLKIFTHAFRKNTRTQINVAFSRCLNECLFMPKLKEIHERMPEPEQYRSEKTGEMMNNICALEPEAKQWSTEERPGVFYVWFGNPNGRKMLLRAERRSHAQPDAPPPPR